MIEVLEDITRGNVVGLEAVGTVTHEDYQEAMIPMLEKVMAEHGKARLLLLMGDRFEGYTAGALWDDATWGGRHVGDFERMCCVTDSALIRGATRMFAPLLPIDLRIFQVDDLAKAKAWITEET